MYHHAFCHIRPTGRLGQLSRFCRKVAFLKAREHGLRAKGRMVEWHRRAVELDLDVTDGMDGNRSMD
jgi:hypothetical protein